jgi:hypothetical protein
MLETKIQELTKAIEALTAALQDQSIAPARVVAIDIDGEAPKPAPKAEPVPNQEQCAVPVPSDQDVKDATLKASRAGHKEAIRAKLSEIGVGKIQDLSAAQSVVFFDWLQTLGGAE